nr:hypothetical protein CACDSRKY_CACDSRKY_CDS_0013 [Caudoviricetes sp.]
MERTQAARKVYAYFTHDKFFRSLPNSLNSFRKNS